MADNKTLQEKLAAVREALEYAAETSPNFRITSKSAQALTLLDEIMATLNSPELVEKVAGDMMEYIPSMPYNPHDITGIKRATSIAQDCARAAITTIKESL